LFSRNYFGIDAEGINREVSSVIECAALCRSRCRQALAIPELSILSIASRLSLRGAIPAGSALTGQKRLTSDKAIAQGILPSLRHIVEKELQSCRDLELESLIDQGQALIDKNPDSHKQYPRGNDYYCAICFSELSNLYMHCCVCEDELGQDFNICASCKSKGDYSHCHTSFDASFRKKLPGELKTILKKVEGIAGPHPLRYEKETGTRLKIAVARYGAKALEEKRDLLASLEDNTKNPSAEERS